MSTIAERVRVEEHNGVLHAFCPYCSRMYATEDFKGEQEVRGVLTRVTEDLDVPANCKRCGCPMDESKAVAFADAQASIYGKAVRRPPADKQIKDGDALTK